MTTVITPRSPIPERGLIGATHTGHDWGYLTEPGAVGHPIEAWRGKVLGGSSAVNGSVIARARTASCGHEISLTAIEFDLLAYLVAHRDQVVDKPQLLATVWGYDDYDGNLVEVYISNLRRKLEVHGPRLIHTIHGHGYVLRVRDW